MQKRFVCVVSLALGSACAVEDQALIGEREGAIVGGQATTIAEFPWQVSLRSSWGGHFCGGSIIDESWVLTAGHCVSGGSGSGLRVVAGVTRQSQGATQQVSVAEVIPYPGYSDPTYGKDAALLRLQSPLVLDGTLVKAIGIVSEGDAAAGMTAEGVIATVSGWGALSGSGGGSPDVLQRLDMPIVSLASADAAYGGGMTADMLPVEAQESGPTKSPCYGDSGGPLVVPDGNGGYRLAGVVSWGDSCTGPKPAIYGRVSAFAPWIGEHAFDDDVDPPPPPPTDGVLANGVPAAGLAAAQGVWLRYTIEVPAGATNLVVATTAAGGQDADLYVRSGAAPSGQAYDCRPYESDASESCAFAAPAAGTVHVAVHAYTAFSGLELTGSYSPP